MTKILNIDGMPSGRKATDSAGRVLSHNATVEDVHAIVLEETQKVHEFYLRQIPPHVAVMIQDALASYALIPQPIATAEAPVVPKNAAGDTAPSDTIAPQGTDV